MFPYFYLSELLRCRILEDRKKASLLHTDLFHVLKQTKLPWQRSIFHSASCSLSFPTSYKSSWRMRGSQKCVESSTFAESKQYCCWRRFRPRHTHYVSSEKKTKRARKKAEKRNLKFHWPSKCHKLESNTNTNKERVREEGHRSQGK